MVPCLPTLVDKPPVGPKWVHEIKWVRERLDRLVTARCPIAGLKVKGAVWVLPDLRAEIAYRGVTTAGELRHASFQGLEE